ncbi:MAG TPA: TetR/AcrR family transcriptional regulator [Polyangiaceae bacterium]|nr:TetR/AcrR family transcriptional regulator [Polyangiaceae bacterium]
MAEESSTPAESPRNPERAGRRPSGFVARKRRGPGSYDRSQSPEERKDEQRRTLVDAAAHVFSRDGFGNASVASILEVSGLSRGTFYRHFKDLREAFLAVQTRAADILLERVQGAFETETEPFEKMRAAVRAYLELVAERGDLSRVFHREALVSGKEWALLRKETLGSVQRVFRDGLELAVKKKLLARVPEEVTLYAVISGIEGVALSYLEDHREDQIQEALEPLLRFCGRAFASS